MVLNKLTKGVINVIRKSNFFMLLIVIWAILFGTFAVASESSYVLTLEDAILMAIEQNPTLKSSYLDEAKAVSDLDLAWRNLFPQMNFQLSYTRLDEGVPTPTGGFDPMTVGYYNLNIEDQSFQIPLKALTPKYEEGSPNMYNTQLAIQQPIFMGGKVTLGIEMAKAGVTLASIESAKILNETVYQTIQTYYNLLMLKEMLQIQETGVDLINEHQRIARTNLEAGLMLKKDVLSVEIEKRKAAQQLKSLLNQFRLAEKQFAQLLGIEYFQYQLLTPTVQVAVKEDLEIQYQEALENRAELKSLQINQEILANNLKMEKRGFWPNVILLGNYSWKGETLSFEDGSWSVTVNTSMNLFDGGISREKQEGLMIQIQKLEQGQKNLADMIRLDVEEALLKVEEKVAELEIQELIYEQAVENMKAASKSYEVGVGTSIELMNAQLSLQQAEMSQVKTKYEHQLSFFKLLYKTGNLMEFLEEVVKSEK